MNHHIQKSSVLASSPAAPEEGFNKKGQEILDPGETSGNLSRRGYFWDEEEEY